VFEAPPAAPPPAAPPAESILPIIPDDFSAGPPAPSASEPEPPARAAPGSLTFFEPPPQRAAPAPDPQPEPPAAPIPAAATEAPMRDRGATDTATPDANALFEAFCAGAKLNPALFAREDRLQLMHNLGAVYQQMVLGLGDLLSERTSVKNEYRMVRTTVRPEGNNPFKWSPPSRVAVDLLRTNDDGFLTGPPAVKESFEDLKKHLLCLLAGLRAALSSTLDTLHPENIESRLEGGGLFGPSKGSRAWGEYRRVFADFKKQADDNPDSQINRDFRAAYEKQLGALDSLKPPR
jgi:type VI secretion system FHA domain protein